MQDKLYLNIFMTLAAVAIAPLSVHGAPPPETTPQLSPAEARGRARLLHETIHATLQIVHHEYYREDEGLKIPAAALSRVFRELENRQHVQLRWLAVNAAAMNSDHEPQDEFENQAVQVLNAGKDEYEMIAESKYRRAAAITLSSECLKCHAPRRTNNEDRIAALIITLPLMAPEN